MAFGETLNVSKIMQCRPQGPLKSLRPTHNKAAEAKQRPFLLAAMAPTPTHRSDFLCACQGTTLIGNKR